MGTKQTGWRRHAGHLGAVCLGMVWLGARTGQTAGITAVVSDLQSQGEGADVAGALSLLVRASLTGGDRALSSRRELALALDLVDGNTRRDALVVNRSTAKAVMERLGSDRIFLGTLQVDAHRWEVRGETLGPEGSRLAVISAAVAPGELGNLARQLTRRLAVRLGLNATEPPDLSLGELRPYARADAAMRHGDAGGAARLLLTANPSIPNRLTSAKELAATVAQSHALAPDVRAQLSLLAADPRDALALADTALRTQPRDLTARASKVRAYTALQDLSRATQELQMANGSTALNPFLAVAKAELALAKHNPADTREALGYLAVEGPDKDDKPVLAFMSGADPGTFDAVLEGRAVKAAHKLSTQNPDLAHSIATRALKGGMAIDEALPLVSRQNLSSTEMTTIESRLQTRAGQAGHGAFSAELTSRQTLTRQLRLGAAATRIVPRDLQPLMADLRAVLGGLPALANGAYGRLMLVRGGNGAGFLLAPVRVRPEQLHDALEAVLTDDPFAVTLAVGNDAADEGAVQNGRVSALAERAGADAALVYAVDASGLSASVALTLVDAVDRSALPVMGLVPGSHGHLARVNPLPLALLGSSGVVLVVFLTLRRRQGSVMVRIQGEVEPEDRFLCLVISSSPVPPPVADALAHVERVKKTGRSQLGLEATLVDRQTGFPKVLTGHWHVHLYGAYKRHKRLRLAKGAVFSQEIQVQARQTSFLTFSLDPVNAEFLVNVQDGGKPVSGADIWVDEARDLAERTGREGMAILEVPRGRHALFVKVGEMRIKKGFEVVKLGPYDINISLDWERRVDDVSRALEHPDEQDLALRRHHSSVALPALPREPRPAEEEGGISISGLISLPPPPSEGEALAETVSFLDDEALPEAEALVEGTEPAGPETLCEVLPETTAELEAEAHAES